MALENLFSAALGSIFGKKTTIDDGNGNLLMVDAVFSENHQFNSQATLHEIEDGSEVTDHIIKKGIILDINGFISDDPINLYSTLAGVGSGLVGGAVGGVAGAITTGVVGKLGGSILDSLNGKPSKDAYDILSEIYEEKLLCTIVTGLKEYTNMAMESFKATRTPENTRALEFTSTFRRINLIKSETILIADINGGAGGVANSSTPTEDLGKQGTISNTTTKGSSILYRMFH